MTISGTLWTITAMTNEEDESVELIFFLCLYQDRKIFNRYIGKVIIPDNIYTPLVS